MGLVCLLGLLIQNGIIAENYANGTDNKIGTGEVLFILLMLGIIIRGVYQLCAPLPQRTSLLTRITPLLRETNFSWKLQGAAMVGLGVFAIYAVLRSKGVL